MMEEPAVKNCLLDMLSVTDTAVNSIRKNPSPQSNNGNNPDVSASQSSSISQESCKESVGGSTTVSEVLIASTNVERCELDDKPLPKQVTVVRHNGVTIKSDVEVIKSQNTLLRILSDSSYDDEAKENLPMGGNVNDSIISVEKRITNPNDKKTDSRKDRFFQYQEVESETCSSARTTTGSSIQDDVKIEQFHLTDKQKSLRQLLGKKSDRSGPVKRVIHPKLLQKQEPVQKMCKKEEGCVSKEMLAASVAASAAAAVAQPFFQFQKEFEEKIHQTYHLVKNNPQSTEDSDKRIEELEKKVSVLNEQRIDHLEKLQQYQMEIQTKMMSQPCKQTIPSYHSAKPGVISGAPGVDRPSQLSPPTFPSSGYFPRQAPQPTHYSYPSEQHVDPSYPREPLNAAYFPRDYPHASRAREPICPTGNRRDHPYTSRPREPMYAADFQRDHPQSRDREPSRNVIFPREDNRSVQIPRDLTSRTHFHKSPPPQVGREKSVPSRDRSFSPSSKKEPAFSISPKKASQVKMSPPRAQSSKTQQSKRKSPPKQEVKYFPRKREQLKRSPVKNKERKDSPLDTPAPRTRIPTPMVYDDDVSHSSDPRFNHGGLLDEMMEKNRSPLRHDKDTTFSVPDDAPQYNRYDYDDREKPVDQASRLLDRMVDLKHQVGRVANTRFDDQFNYGPYPLDPYLKTGRGSDVKTQPLQVNAPVYNNYSDVKKVLNTVNKKISQLESNLKHVTRFQNEDELSCLAKVLQGESEDLEQNKIKSMVDRLIKSKRKIIEDDVQRELLNAELKKQELLEASKKPSTKDLNKKVGAGSRVSQTYQRKRETTRYTQDRERSVVSRPYGKNLLPSNTARVGRSEPISSKVDSKTVYKTLITQTKQSTKIQQRQQHQQPVYRQQQTVPVINNIMPMAVALCEPRYLPGRTAGVLSCEPMACSSPSSQTHPTSLPNLSNIQDTTFIDQINSPSLSPRSPGHHSPTHSMVDNYSDVEGTGIILPGYQHEVYKQPPEPSRVVFKPPNLESYDQNPTSDVIANDIHRQNLLQEKASQWLESELMAQVLSQVNRGGEEKIHHESSWGTDNQYNYRNLVNKQPGVDQDSQISDDSATQSESVEEDLQEKIQKIFISVGQPVNSKIISTLVQEALTDRVRTLLGETQPSTSGTKPDKTTTDREEEEVKDDYDDDFESGDSPEPSMKQLPTPDLTPMSSLTDSPVRQESPPPTKLSPVRSPKPRVPRRQKVEEVDDSDVYNSMVMTREPEPKLPPQQVTVPSPDSDSDPSTSYDISQELRRLAVRPEEKADFIIQSVHDVETPVPTPPPRSPTPVQTLPQFIASPPPPVSVQQPVPVQQSIREEPSVHDVSRSRQDLDATGTSFNFNRNGMSVENVQDVRKSTTIVKMSSTVRDSIEVPQPQESPRPIPQPTVIHVGSPQAISPVRDPSLIPSPDQRSSPSTSITDTINECISEGQWLLNRSEGQVAEIPIDPGVIENIKFNRIDISTASTLRDTEDLDLDDLDNLKSEGEFIHYSSVPVQQDINSLLQKQQESYRRDHVDGPGYPTHHSQELNVTESMGELSLGQIQSSRVGQPQPFQANGDTYAEASEEEDNGPTNVIRVGESLPSTSQRNFSRPPASQTGPQFSTYTRQSRDENGTSRDSTMNLEDLDISKRKLPPSRKWNDKPKTTTFSMSVESMRSSGGLEMTESELESERYGVRESQDSDRYRLGDTLDSDRYRLGESADSDRYKYHDLLDSDRYKFRQSMDSEMSAQTNEDEPEEQDRKDPKTQSGPYRMSVTVPSVHPISEDEDTEEISEIDATVSK